MIFTTPTTYDPAGGYSGPNDRAYKALSLEAAARELRNAIEFHCGYSHSSCVTPDHPLVVSMKHLAEQHIECVACANRGHDPYLFEVPDYTFVTPDDYWAKVSAPS